MNFLLSLPTNLHLNLSSATFLLLFIRIDLIHYCSQAAHNIGFAMDSPDGLIVPNIKNVQNLSVLEIAVEMSRLIELGEQGKLGQDDITGGTFSLSNIGSVSVTYLE